jgi:hypothetical protein
MSSPGQSKGQLLLNTLHFIRMGFHFVVKNRNLRGHLKPWQIVPQIFVGFEIWLTSFLKAVREGEGSKEI